MKYAIADESSVRNNRPLYLYDARAKHGRWTPDAAKAKAYKTETGARKACGHLLAPGGSAVLVTL